MRRRIVKETEVALTYGLRFPKRMRRIPSIEVGRAPFDPAFARKFWAEALDLDEDDLR